MTAFGPIETSNYGAESLLLAVRVAKKRIGLIETVWGHLLKNFVVLVDGVQAKTFAQSTHEGNLAHINKPMTQISIEVGFQLNFL